MKRRKVEPMARVVKSYLRVSGLDRRLANLDLEMAWADVVKEMSVGRSRITSLRGGVLTVEIESPAMKFELENFSRDVIIKRLNQALVKDQIRSLKLKVGSFPEETSRKDVDGEDQGIREAEDESNKKRG